MMDPVEVVCEIVDWIHVAQDRDQWRSFVSTWMKFLVPQRVA